ncbi:hypothetical protein HY992_00120 [Candidatus Micrarchaeota archaeon]|nr:hypothetical protein [Candidatus Micrarchaeota archaeon]
MTTEAATGAAAGFTQDLYAAVVVAATNSVQKVVTDTITVVPGIVAAILIFALGWGVASVLARFVEVLLKAVKIEDHLAQHGMKDAMGKVKLSNVLVKLSKYYVLLIFLQTAVSFLKLGEMSTLLSGFIGYAPKVIFAALLVVAGALLGEIIKEKVVEIEPKSTKMNLIGKWGKYLVVFVTLLSALEMAEFKIGVIISTYTILLQGIVFGVALAFAIAFGLGAQEEAKSTVKEMKGRVWKAK